MALFISFADLPHEATTQLLKESMVHQMVRQMPLHKRAKAAKKYAEEDEASEKHEYGKQSDYDREQLADLKEQTVKAPAIPIGSGDFAPDVAKKAIPHLPKKVGGKSKRKKV